MPALAVALAVSVTGIPAPAVAFEELSVVTEVTVAGTTVKVTLIVALAGAKAAFGVSESVRV